MSGEPPAGGSITGTLKWLAAGDIADYWGAGNFIALAFEPGDEGATVSVGLDPSQGSGLVPLDEDLNGVFKVTDPAAQVFVVETTKDGQTLRQEFDLSGLVLEPEPTPEPPELVATPSTLDLAVGDTGDVVLSLSDGSPLDFTKLAWNTMPDVSVASVTGGDPATGTVTFTAAGAGTTQAVLSYPNGPDTRSTAIIEIGVSAPARTPILAAPNSFSLDQLRPCEIRLTVDGEPYENEDLNVTLNGVLVTDEAERLPWAGDFPEPPATPDMHFRSGVFDGMPDLWELTPYHDGEFVLTFADKAGVYEPATVTITVALTPTGFTISPNPVTVAVGESVTLHGFVDGVEIDNGDLAFDGDFNIADETIADHSSLNDPTIVHGKTAGATSVTVSYLDYPTVTVPVTVTGS